jgi:hypothetical protein
MDNKITVETQEQMELLIEQLQPSTSQTHPSDGKRKNWRRIYETPGTLELKSNLGNSDPIFISIRDINKEGLGFFSRCRLIVGQKFIINMAIGDGEIEVPAAVIHCTETFGMFKVGVKFDFCDILDNEEKDA